MLCRLITRLHCVRARLCACVCGASDRACVLAHTSCLQLPSQHVFLSPSQLEDYKREVQLLREENNILRAKLEGRATLHQHMIADAPM